MRKTNKESYYFSHDYNPHTEPKMEKLIFDVEYVK